MANQPTQPAPSLVATTVEDLQRNAPFDAMDLSSLQYIASRLSLKYFAKGQTLLSPQDGVSKYFFIVQKGSVTGLESNSQSGHAWALTLTDGECFPVGALIARRPGVLTYTAMQDTFCYQLPLADFEHVMDISRPFRNFATRRIAALLEQSRRSVQSQYTARVSDAQGLASTLKSIIRREPVTVTPDTLIRTVLERMKALRIGSVVVADAAGQPLGIFTERDVLDRIALAGIAQDAPIEQAMTPKPFSLPSHAALFEAAQAMARFRFRHVLVMEEGKLIGVVSERDLFTLQRLSLGEIAKAIEQSESAEALSHASGEVRRLAGALLAQGVGAEQLTQFVTTLNDAVAGRALALAARENAPPDMPWCWLGLGSEGRMEQTLATDQDNALIFVPPVVEAIPEARAAFLKFADSANRILDLCGFPLCKGDIMARNPKWCLTPTEWRKTFAGWMSTPEPEALLNAAIFFDFRALHGDLELAETLRQWLMQQAPPQTMFFLLMTQNALQVRPPLGVLRDFVADDSDMPGTIDLKKYGARTFVDAARIFALKHGISASNTAERIRLAAPKMRMRPDEADAIVDGFHFLQLLRLRNQEGADPYNSPADGPGTGGASTSIGPVPNPNRINPDELNSLDRRILKEALRQARKLQSRLELDFPH
ncbi:MAG: CBS domain-containing protein [Betaproteobacteria bacterium]|nr:CBS domain-containing protein [Betaproteobacteria bacterium]